MLFVIGSLMDDARCPLQILSFDPKPQPHHASILSRLMHTPATVKIVRHLQLHGPVNKLVDLDLLVVGCDMQVWSSFRGFDPGGPVLWGFEAKTNFLKNGKLPNLNRMQHIRR